MTLEEAKLAELAECEPIVKFLSAGDFYFTRGELNLTRCLQSSHAAADNAVEQFDDWLDSFDETFFWNRHMLQFFVEHELKQFIVPVIKGFVGFVKHFDIESQRAELVLISRVGCQNAGTRYNARGVNDDGAVANFVESEMLLILPEHTLSYVQVRGSVPLFWEQKFVTTSYQVSLTRGVDATGPAFARHFEREHQRLAMPASIVCLLSPKSEKENLLLLALRDVVAQHNAAATADDQVPLIEYDVRTNCKNMAFSELKPFVSEIHETLTKNAYFWQGRNAGEVLGTQNGVVRTNCLDCLDRTNFVQTALAWAVLIDALRQLRLAVGDDDTMTETHLYGVFLKLWEENGVQLSTQYAGAASSKSKYTRKGEQTTVGFLSGVFDAAKTTTQRLYANTFLDTARQLAMDAVLGKGVDPNAAKRDAAYNAELRKRIDQFSSVTDRYVMVATWNVNGQEPSNEDITPWLLPNTSASAPAPDVYVIGFQEIVDLTAQNVLYVTDQTNSFAWERHIQKVVTERTADGYVLIKTRQLVGVLLMVYVRKAIVGDVRSLGVNMVKLGYGGMTGNKGAIGVRLELGATSLCFVCAHLAAGQKNVEERNQNWNDAQQTLKFGRRNQWSVDSHDLSIWLGDFNYRIDLEREDVIDAVKKGDYKPLIAADQLQQERAAGHAFTGYHEGAITFAPTYKYDVGTDIYDTSEKARSPAYTDRVLYKVAADAHVGVQLLDYSRAELKASDHRPVRALFRVGVRYVDERKKRAISVAVRREIMSASDGAHVAPGVLGIDESDLARVIGGADSSLRSSSVDSVSAEPPAVTPPPKAISLIDFDDPPPVAAASTTSAAASSSSSSLAALFEMSTPAAPVAAPVAAAAAAPPVAAAAVPATLPESVPPTMNDPSTWAASKTECARYAGIFRTIDTDNDGMVTGGEARPIFLRSNLPGPDLAAIWALCDTNHSGRLNVRQFALGLWLCNARMRGAPLLQALPPRLVASLQAGGYDFVEGAPVSATPPPTATAPQQQAPPRSSSAASLLDLMM
jgi:endonuclease/exonuclease/phosphatase family metal-dependent hydrolase